MVQIPQQFRQRMASSVVGTPGVDTSGQQIGEIGQRFGQEVANDAFSIAIEDQKRKDAAEANLLVAKNKMDTTDLLEKYKTDYAGNPEEAEKHFWGDVKNLHQQTMNQASNSRVKLLASQRDPYFDGRVAVELSNWQHNQRQALDKANLEGQANDVFNKAEEIGFKDGLLLQKQNSLNDLAHVLGSLSAGAHGMTNPEKAAEFENRLLPTLATRAVYGMLRTNPYQAVAYLDSPDMDKMFKSNPKELESLRQTANSRAEGWAKEVKWRSMAIPLADSPQIVNDVLTEKVDWNTLDKMPQNELTTQLKKMALDTSPKNVEEEQRAMVDFYDETHKLGINVKGKSPEGSVADMVKYSADLAKAYNGGLITKSTYENFNRQLATPLIGAVLKAHDPNWFEQVGANVGSWWSHHKNPEDTVDKYVGGYDVINKYLQSIGKEKDWNLKAHYINSYVNNIDKIGSANMRDESGQPFTPHSMAQRLLGLKLGGTFNSPIGRVSLDYFSDDGQPGHTFTKEEQERFDQLKKVK